MRGPHHCAAQRTPELTLLPPWAFLPFKERLMLLMHSFSRLRHSSYLSDCSCWARAWAERKLQLTTGVESEPTYSQVDAFCLHHHSQSLPFEEFWCITRWLWCLQIMGKHIPEDDRNVRNSYGLKLWETQREKKQSHLHAFSNIGDEVSLPSWGWKITKCSHVMHIVSIGNIRSNIVFFNPFRISLFVDF